MQLRAAGLDRVVQTADLLPGLGSLPPQYRHFSPVQIRDTRHRYYRHGLSGGSVGHDSRKEEVNNVDHHRASEKSGLGRHYYLSGITASKGQITN